MNNFLLIRHGDADYSQPAKWETAGWGSDLAPLSVLGLEQIEGCLTAVKEYDPVLLLSSPMTRALQSAALLQAKLSLPLKVEFDLHEWVPDSSFRWITLDEVNAQLTDLDEHSGEWPPGEQKLWEPLSHVRARVAAVLERYRKYDRVAVVCHGIVMRSLTGRRDVNNAEQIQFSLPAIS